MKKSTLLKLRAAKEEYLLDSLGGETKPLSSYVREHHLSNLKQEYYRQYFDGEIDEEQFAAIAFPVPMSKKEIYSQRLANIETVIMCAFENNVSLPTEWTVERNELLELLKNA